MSDTLDVSSKVSWSCYMSVYCVMTLVGLHVSLHLTEELFIVSNPQVLLSFLVVGVYRLRCMHVDKKVHVEFVCVGTDIVAGEDV